MKTLDEVIEAMERCSIPHYFDCKGCPYEDDDAEVGCRSDDRDADALYYLKWFRARDNMSRKLDREDNEPLTWDELKSMEGKPVWVEEKYSFSNEWHGRWEVICSVCDDEWDDDRRIDSQSPFYECR
jgi:hypothetical protein